MVYAFRLAFHRVTDGVNRPFRRLAPLFILKLRYTRCRQLETMLLQSALEQLDCLVLFVRRFRFRGSFRGHVELYVGVEAPNAPTALQLKNMLEAKMATDVRSFSTVFAAP